MSSKRTHTDPAAAGQHRSPGGMRTLNVGVAAGRAICAGRVTSLVVPGTARAWLPNVRAGARIRLAFNGRRRGSAIVAVTSACFHGQIAEIPACERRHDPNAIEGDGSWDQILNKALWGSAGPVEPEVAVRRAAMGWYLLDFTVRWRHAAWCAAMGIAEPRAA